MDAMGEHRTGGSSSSNKQARPPACAPPSHPFCESGGHAGAGVVGIFLQSKEDTSRVIVSFSGAERGAARGQGARNEVEKKTMSVRPRGPGKATKRQRG